MKTVKSQSSGLKATEPGLQKSATAISRDINKGLERWAALKAPSLVAQNQSKLKAPVGQDASHFRQEKKTKINIRFEFDNKIQKQVKKDVHAGTKVNPIILFEQNQTENAHLKEFKKRLSQADTLPGDEADDLIEKFGKEETPVRLTDDIIESHQIESIFGALRFEENYKVLEKICVQFRIQDVSEFNLERLSQQNQIGSKQSILKQSNQAFQLFGRDQYLISKMNPYHIAIIFNNLKGLRYLTIRLNQHLRLCLNAPDINYGGLQVRDQNIINRECWSLFVAINNINLSMLMFLWQDIGNDYNISVGTGYGNVNSRLVLEVGQDRKFQKLGYNYYKDTMQMPLAPSGEHQTVVGNGNSSRLWDQSHLLAVVKVLAQQKFCDGLKFILSCQATHNIYCSMSINTKLHFLSHLLSKQMQDSIHDIEIREILKFKLTEKPYATLAIFTMIQLDNEAFQKSIQVGTSAKKSEKKQAKAQIKQLFQYINSNLVHLQNAADNLDEDQFMKMKFEFKYYDEYITKNLQNLIKVSAKQDSNTFQLANKLVDNISAIQSKMMDSKGSRFKFLWSIQESLTKFIYNEVFRKNWLDYHDIIFKQMFYWAKTGEIDQFEQAVRKYNISCFERIDVEYQENQRATVARYHYEQQSDDQSSTDSERDEDVPGQPNLRKQLTKKKKNKNKRRMTQDVDEFEYEYALANLDPEINLFNEDKIVAELTPLHIAIQYRHFDLVRFIMERMNLDKRIALAVFVRPPRTEEPQEQTSANFKDGNQLIQAPEQIYSLSYEQQSYALLIASSNHDLLTLRYLWENFGTTFWVLGNFKTLMKQLIAQKYIEAIKMIFESEVTKQMVKCLSSNERSNFIEEYIGHPFQKSFDAKVRNCLLENLCQEPYAGALIILLLEYFEQLHSIKRKNATSGQVIISLGVNPQEAQIQFKNVWDLCLEGIYPIEIQVLKETCRDRFTDFVQYLDDLDSKQKVESERIQAIKLIQLLKGSPGYRNIVEIPEDETTDQQIDDLDDENESDLDMLLRKTHALNFQLKEFRFYKKISNQTENFERALKAAPPIHSQLMKHLMQGNIPQLQDIIMENDIQCQDLLAMRGLNFTVPIAVYEKNVGLAKLIKIDTFEWNPIHFATIYKEFKVLEFFKNHYGESLDLIWAMKLSSGSSLRSGNFQNYFAEENGHLYGFLISLLTTNIELLEQICHISESGGLHVDEVIELLTICKDIKWMEGFICLLKCQMVKAVFTMASLQHKYDLVSTVLSLDFVEDLVAHSLDDNHLHCCALVKDIKQVMYNEPYVSVCWLIGDPLLESEFEYRRYMNIIKLNFTPKSIVMLDTMDQAVYIQEFCKSRQRKMKMANENKATKIQQEIREFQLRNEHISDPSTLKDMQQSLKDLEKVNIQNDIIFNFQDQIIAKIELQNQNKYTRLREKDEYLQILQKICNDVLFPEMLHADHDRLSLGDFQDIIKDEGIEFLQSLKGYEMHGFGTRWEQHMKNFADGFEQTSMNLIHWIILAKRTDIFSWVLESEFKNGVAGEVQAFQKCFVGEKSKFYVTGQVQLGNDQEFAEQFTCQLKGAGQQDLDGDFSDAIHSQLQKNLRLQIKSLGFALIISTMNTELLSTLLQAFPTVLQSLKNTSDCADDILDGILLCCLKQWHEGVDHLKEQAEIAFSQLSLEQKFLFVNKIFAIQKYYKHRPTQRGCETLLNLPKIRNYIMWSQQQPQFETILKKVAIEIHPQDFRGALTGLITASPHQEPSKLDDSDSAAIAEFDALVAMLKSNFLAGYGSTTFQKILMADAQRDKHAANSRKAREEQALEFLNRRNEESLTVKTAN